MNVIKGRTLSPDLPGYGTHTEPEPDRAYCTGCHARRDTDCGRYCGGCADFICESCLGDAIDADDVRCASCAEAFDRACRDERTNQQMNRARGK